MSYDSCPNCGCPLDVSQVSGEPVRARCWTCGFDDALDVEQSRKSKRVRNLVAALAVALLALVASGCMTADQQFAFDLVNLSRGANGRHLLTMNAVATAKAQDWSAYLAARSSLEHQDLYVIMSATGARAAAENVGYAGTIEDVHRAFWNSTPHRANMLGDYTHLGTGVTRSAGRVYVVQVFLRL